MGQRDHFDTIIVEKFYQSLVLIFGKGRSHDDPPEAQGLPCNKWRTVSVIERIEKDYRKPVVSNTQAWVWEALRLMNMPNPILGYGRLLSEFK